MNAIYQSGSARLPTDENSLAHYGIPNMHWGVRRFQDKLGRLTPEGKERYRKHAEMHNSESRKSKSAKGVARGVPESKTWKPNEASDLSDDELNRRNSRLQRERQYRDMTTPEWKKEAKQIAKDAFKKIFIGTATTLAVVAMKKNYENIVSWMGQQATKTVAQMASSKPSLSGSLASASSKYGRTYSYNPHRPKGENRFSWKAKG